MIVEMTAVNRRKWSHETVASVTGGPRGSVTSVLTSLARGPLSESESEAFKDIDFGDVEDPLIPDWRRLEEAGVLPALREAKAAIYAHGVVTEAEDGTKSLAEVHGDEGVGRIPQTSRQRRPGSLYD